jgi:hypothetical protein
MTALYISKVRREVRHRPDGLSEPLAIDCSSSTGAIFLSLCMRAGRLEALSLCTDEAGIASDAHLGQLFSASGRQENLLCECEFD